MKRKLRNIERIRESPSEQNERAQDLMTVFNRESISLEAAQSHYRTVRELLDGLLPFNEWYPLRQDGVTARHYWLYVGALQRIARRLEDIYGVDILGALSVAEQGEWLQ